MIAVDDIPRHPPAREFEFRAWFMMVLKKSAKVRARTGDAIRDARVRRKGRSRIAELVRVELNRDNSIFDLEADKVNGVTFGRYAVTDSKGRSWRYRDILAAQARYFREQAERDGGRGPGCKAQADGTFAGVGCPDSDPALAALNDRSAVDHVVDGHENPLADAKFLTARAVHAAIDWRGAVIKHVTGAPVKAVKP